VTSSHPPGPVGRSASPPAEVEIDADLVRSLLAEQHPDLADLGVAMFEAGWDNSLWRVGDGLVARLPRRAMSAPLVLHEQQWLPELSRTLPLPVPAPVRVGVPSDLFQWHWSVVPWIDGVPGDRARWGDPDASAARLGEFLRALHVPAPHDAPSNPYRGVPLAEREAAFEQRMAMMAAEVDEVALRSVWDEARRAPVWAGESVWLHGDLHPANALLVDGVLGGVIDFGDICAGDPATDLAAVWMMLPSTSMSTVIDVYGGIDDATLTRARGWAVLFGLLLLDIGLNDKPTYEALARATLDRVVAR